MFRRLAVVLGASGLLAGGLLAIMGQFATKASFTPTVSAQATAEAFRHARFSHPLRIDNRWTPLAPGSEFVLEGHVSEGRRLVAHRIVSIVTDMTKVIDGVQTVVIWERDFSAGKLAESELFFVAQDDNRNVWLFGEYPEIYEGGPFQGAPDTWVVPAFGAQPGVFMLAAPFTGAPSYSQGLALHVGFYDRARVLRTGLRVCVPLRCFRHVLEIDEYGPLAPGDGHQRKFYAPGVGGILTKPAGGRAQESVSLTDVVRLNRVAMAAVRQGVIETERRAYRAAKPTARRRARRRDSGRRPIASGHRWHCVAARVCVEAAPPCRAPRPGLDRMQSSASCRSTAWAIEI